MQARKESDIETEEDFVSGFTEAFCLSKRKGVSKRQMRRQVQKYFNDLNRTLTPEDSPVIHLAQEVVQAGNLIGFAKALSRRTIVYQTGLVKIEGKITLKVMRKLERVFKNDVLGYLDEDMLVTWITKPPKEAEADRAAMKDKLLPYSFMKAWTALELYLEMRVRTRVFLNQGTLMKFAKRVQEDLPNNWREINKAKQPIEYAENIGEIIDDYLTFPYHSFDEKGRTQRIYRQCFDIHLTSFERASEIQELASKRHHFVHKGTALFGLPTMQFSYSGVKDALELILEFVEWIEQEIRSIDKTTRQAK